MIIINNINKLINLSQYAQILQILNKNNYITISLLSKILNENSKRIRNIIEKLKKLGIIVDSELTDSEKDSLQANKGYNAHNLQIMRIFRVTNEAKNIIKEKIKKILKKTSNRVSDWLEKLKKRKENSKKKEIKIKISKNEYELTKVDEFIIQKIKDLQEQDLIFDQIRKYIISKYCNIKKFNFLIENYIDKEKFKYKFSNYKLTKMDEFIIQKIKKLAKENPFDDLKKSTVKNFKYCSLEKFDYYFENGYLN